MFQHSLQVQTQSQQQMARYSTKGKVAKTAQSTIKTSKQPDLFTNATESQFYNTSNAWGQNGWNLDLNRFLHVFSLYIILEVCNA